MISKNLNKFEVKILNVHTIPNTGLVTAEEATSMYTEIEDDCLQNERLAYNQIVYPKQS